jgi:hypothetical protein
VAVKEIDTEAAAVQALFEMANLRPERTGLPVVVLISQRGGARHDVRMKLARAAKASPSEMITVAVRPAPRIIRGEMTAREFNLVKRWIELNQDVLVNCWNGVIEYTEDALAAIRPISDPDQQPAARA